MQHHEIEILFPYSVTVEPQNRDSGALWCYHQLGAVAAVMGGNDVMIALDRRWLMKGNTFLFRLREDQAAFLQRWEAMAS